MKILVVIDMQNDFVTGALGTKEAEAIVPRVVKRIEEAEESGEEIIFTRDTHGDDYSVTREGRRLPVSHCIKGSSGWMIVPELGKSANGHLIVDKPTFGSEALPDLIRNICGGAPEELELIGLCTDICVISNTMVLKAAFPEAEISVRASCCAGVTPESHRTALDAMSACQIDII